MEFKKTKIQKKACELLRSIIVHILLVGGSRSGKTFIFIYSIFVRALKCPESRHLIVRKTRVDVCASIWQESIPKVLSVCFPGLRRGIDFEENKTMLTITFPNGSEIWLAGLDDGATLDKILGKEYSTIYFNECSNIKFESILKAITRLAQLNELVKHFYYDANPPTKSHWLYRLFVLKQDPESKLKKRIENPDDYTMLYMNPIDNRENLDPSYQRLLDNLPPRAKKRFRDGEFLDDIEGALWKWQTIEDSRVYMDACFDLIQIVVAVDPAVSQKKTSDETGIVVCAKSKTAYFVLEDLSGIYAPLVWAKIVVDAFLRWNANLIIGEDNNGGDLVASNVQAFLTIQKLTREINENKKASEAVIEMVKKDYTQEEIQYAIDRIDFAEYYPSSVPFVSIRATQGKCKRFEPVAALYEGGHVHHVGTFPEMEDQMTSWVPDSDDSPDRLDAMCWGMTKLMNRVHQIHIG